MLKLFKKFIEFFKYKKIDFIENEVCNDIIKRNLESYLLLLDTGEYVPEQFLKKLYKNIFSIYKKQMRKYKKEAEYRRKNPTQESEEVPVKETEEVKIITPEMVTISNTKGELTWEQN